MRDATAGGPTLYVFGGFRLDTTRRSLATADGQAVPLTGKAYELLLLLVQHRGELVPKRALVEALWPDAVVEENNLSQAVSALRVALDDDSRSPRYIATVKGRGYQFIAPVTAEDGAVPAASPSRRPGLLLGAAVAIVLGLAIFALTQLRQEPESGATQAEPPTAALLESFDNASLRLVTDFPGSHTDPTLSPDGTMLAFVSTASGSPQIWVQNLQRGDALQITDGPHAASAPAWAPDNSQVIFSRESPFGPGLYSVGTLGTPKPRQISEHGDAPAYAAHSGDLVFSVGMRVYVDRHDGNGPMRVDGLPRSQGFARPMPALSPDGAMLTFIHADAGPLGNVWVKPLPDGEARQLTNHEEDGVAVHPVFSPDGRYVVYATGGGTGDGQLWRVDVQTGDVLQLTRGSGEHRDPVISTSGDRLAFAASHSVWKIVRIDPLTGERSDILETRMPIVLPDVSRDGKRIVFFSMLGSGQQVFTVNIDGSNLEQQTFDEAGENALPVWHDDKILFYRKRSLHRIDPQTGAGENVASDFHWSTRNWIAATGNRLSYHNIDRPAGLQRALVRGFGESDETELSVPLEGGQWSADGTRLLGFYRRAGEIHICDPDTGECNPITYEGEPIRGLEPKWSADESHVYYRRYDKDGACCSVWRTHINGSAPERIAELTGYETNITFFDIGPGDAVYYNYADRSADEIWIAEAPD